MEWILQGKTHHNVQHTAHTSRTEVNVTSPKPMPANSSASTLDHLPVDCIWPQSVQITLHFRLKWPILQTIEGTKCLCWTPRISVVCGGELSISHKSYKILHAKFSSDSVVSLICNFENMCTINYVLVSVGTYSPIHCCRAGRLSKVGSFILLSQGHWFSSLLTMEVEWET